MGKIITFVVLLASVLGFWLYKNAGSERDFRTAKINDEGIELVNFSFKRKMVSKIIIDKEDKVWVPEGYGWYRSGSVKKLLENEKKMYLLDKMVLYGFGFDVDLWMENGQSSVAMIKKWGWYPWLRFKIEESGWLYKEESEINDRIMIRDMADSDILESKIRVIVYNCSNENGLASFVGKSIERLGFAVIGWDNSEIEDITCRVLAKEKEEIFLNHFSDCEFKVDPDLPENEIEIYFGEKFAQMINYKSYVGTL